jgi:hypothetical protein
MDVLGRDERGRMGLGRGCCTCPDAVVGDVDPTTMGFISVTDDGDDRLITCAFGSEPEDWPLNDSIIGHIEGCVCYHR